MRKKYATQRLLRCVTLRYGMVENAHKSQLVLLSWHLFMMVRTADTGNVVQHPARLLPRPTCEVDTVGCGRIYCK